MQLAVKRAKIGNEKRHSARIGGEKRVRNLFKVLLVACCLYGLPALHAAEPATDKSPQSETTQTEQPGTPQKKKGSVSLFWVVFIIAILFVLSSATALNSLGRRPPSHNKGANAPQPRRKSAKDERRFRL